LTFSILWLTLNKKALHVKFEEVGTDGREFDVGVGAIGHLKEGHSETDNNKSIPAWTSCFSQKWLWKKGKAPFPTNFQVFWPWLSFSSKT